MPVISHKLLLFKYIFLSICFLSAAPLAYAEDCIVTPNTQNYSYRGYTNSRGDFPIRQWTVKVQVQCIQPVVMFLFKPTIELPQHVFLDTHASSAEAAGIRLSLKLISLKGIDQQGKHYSLKMFSNVAPSPYETLLANHSYTLLRAAETLSQFNLIEADFLIELHGLFSANELLVLDFPLQLMFETLQ